MKKSIDFSGKICYNVYKKSCNSLVNMTILPLYALRLAQRKCQSLTDMIYLFCSYNVHNKTFNVK